MSWLSDQLKKSQKKGTGIFSWGESDLLNLVPGIGGTLDELADQIGSTAGGQESIISQSKPRILSSSDVDNQKMLMYAGGAILLYMVLK